MKTALLPAVWTAIGLLLTIPMACAHSIGVSRGEYQVSGSVLNAELTFARGELALAIPALDTNRDDTISEAELLEQRELLTQSLLRGLQVSGPHGSCIGGLNEAGLRENDGIAVYLSYRCLTVESSYSARFTFLSSLTTGHRHLAVVGAGSHTNTLVVYESQPLFALSAGAESNAASTAGWPLFRLGIEHILTGYDHLVFLLGLILVGGRLRSILIVVTAFTLAHSISLGVATLGVLVPSPRLIEPAIALSIAYVGIENWFVGDAVGRWRITFPFGLIHGFGFAGALQEISLPQSQIPLALASFNAGVETGQLAVLSVALPVLWWANKQTCFARYGVRALSSVIAIAGIAWAVVRLS